MGTHAFRSMMETRLHDIEYHHLMRQAEKDRAAWLADHSPANLQSQPTQKTRPLRQPGGLFAACLGPKEVRKLLPQPLPRSQKQQRPPRGDPA